MEQMKMKTPNIAEENVQKIKVLFPNCVTEAKDEKTGELKQVVDFDMLRQELSNEVVEGPQERYQFTWPDKRKAILLANSATSNTLRPLVEKSVNFNDTQNIYIEGDNLEALKILRETYMGKIKMIYIDPPYNTGNDFVYNDDFNASKEDYLNLEHAVDEVGNHLLINSESVGKFHTNWLNMLYPRISLARDLLTDDGAIFVSIDDNEQTNFKKILDEIFGEENKVAEFVVIRSEGGGMAKQVIKGHDYLFVYAKNISEFSPLGKPKDIRGQIIEKDGEKYWIQEDWLRKEFGKYGNCHYEEILQFKGQEKLDEINEGLKQGKYVLLLKSNNMHIVGKLRNIKEDSSKFYSVLKHLSANGVKDLQDLGLSDCFSYPKPVSLIKEIVGGMTIFSANKGDIILDFFSGSGTTAQAVMELNKEDNGNRKFILIQLPEKYDVKSEPFKDGYRTICDCGIERIKRAGEQINNQSLINTNFPDFGFKVLSIDSSNMKNVFYNPSEYTPKLFDDADSAIKEDRTALDLLFQTMLELGITLDAKIEEHKIGEFTYYAVNGNDLIGCFEKNINEDVLTELAKLQPLTVAFRDDSFPDDQTSVNCEQIFKQMSPATKLKIV